MKKTAVIMFVMLTCTMSIAAGEIDFVDTYTKAKQIAAEQDKNMLITFYADW